MGATHALLILMLKPSQCDLRNRDALTGICLIHSNLMVSVVMVMY